MNLKLKATEVCPKVTVCTIFLHTINGHKRLTFLFGDTGSERDREERKRFKADLDLGGGF